MTQRPWTDEERGFIADHPEWPAWRVGEELARTQSAVEHARKKMRQGWMPSSTREFWSNDDIDFVSATRHLTAREVATCLGRTVASVQGQRQKLAALKGSGFITWNSDPSHIGGRTLVAKTCVKCGLILDSKWFPKNRANKPNRQRACMRCKPHSGRRTSKQTAQGKKESQKRLQSMTLPHAHRAREPWIDADHPILSDPDLDMVEKALRLGRTYYATSIACARSGYTSKRGFGKPENYQWLIDAPEIDKLLKDAA